jgi:O-acetylhomoserine/O-acetylserine sulfhydrylase-like pyridoxal-dependent enzyme
MKIKVNGKEQEFTNAVNEKTIAIYFETITNPQLQVADIRLLSTIAKEHGILGACLSPYHAYLQSLVLEILSLRYDKAASNCFLLAEYLHTERKITKVNYPGLQNSKFYEVGKRQFGKSI